MLVLDYRKSSVSVISFLGLLISLGGYSQDHFPSDKAASRETTKLYQNLKDALQKGIMYGHQDDLAYGVKWKYEPGNSDVKGVTGDYPAVFGFELGRLELDQQVNIDSVPFDKMKDFIKTAYRKGAVITLSWHLNNPVTGKTAWDPRPGTVDSILPGGSKHELYLSWLKKVGTFLQDLKGDQGEYIPVIFRPFHELNGNWFWWGKDHCTPEAFISLWRNTVSYLRDSLAIHHLLYAYNTDRFHSEEEYLTKFPGDDWTDIIGFDIYQRQKGDSGNAEFTHAIDTMAGILEKLATATGKIPAVTEFGYGGIPDTTWWTNVLLPGIEKHHLSYVLAWRNAGEKPNGTSEFYTSYRGHFTARDFMKFYMHPKTLFQSDIAQYNLYQ